MKYIIFFPIPLVTQSLAENQALQDSFSLVIQEKASRNIARLLWPKNTRNIDTILAQLPIKADQESAVTWIPSKPNKNFLQRVHSYCTHSQGLNAYENVFIFVSLEILCWLNLNNPSLPDNKRKNPLILNREQFEILQKKANS